MEVKFNRFDKTAIADIVHDYFNVGPNIDRRGKTQPGKTYEFDTPSGKKNIRDDSKGHSFKDDPSQNRGPHFNDDQGRHYDYKK